ncbi:ABC transporter permease subunit [Terribacillus sp. DMT04]|uniref:ABC transporter permease subunit n=1 Tax=Terribacillus sp. DMT04 TaxID=2850441 RepID=UPI001C2BBC98|nr:ABC transporter permease subunit [Terribacillus sp. DMT04]QXE01557.1 ABC transporter permease subunit [Terribacillus sp. DMT04]
MRILWIPSFLIGSLILASLLLGSILYSLLFDSYIAQTSFAYNDAGELQGPPFAPFEFSFLGTDHFGNHLAPTLLMGAKYTIGGVIAIALIGILMAFVSGTVLGFYKIDQLRILIKNSLFAFYFIPGSLLAYLILKPILWEPFEGFHYSLAERIIIQIVVIGVLLAPPATLLVADTVQDILMREYALVSKTLGATRRHLFRVHVLPGIFSTLLQLLFNCLVQAFLIIGHLSIFKLFFGGTKVSYDPFSPSPPAPITNEWFSYMGNYYDSFLTGATWLLWVPLLAIVLSIISFQLMIRGIQQYVKQ